MLRNFEIYDNSIFLNELGFLGFFKVSWGIQRRIVGFGSRGHVQSPEIIEMRVFGFSHKQKSYKLKLKQNITELLSILFP